MSYQGGHPAMWSRWRSSSQLSGAYGPNSTFWGEGGAAMSPSTRRLGMSPHCPCRLLRFRRRRSVLTLHAAVCATLFLLSRQLSSRSADPDASPSPSIVFSSELRTAATPRSGDRPLPICSAAVSGTEKSNVHANCSRSCRRVRCTLRNGTATARSSCWNASGKHPCVKRVGWAAAVDAGGVPTVTPVPSRTSRRCASAC